MTRFSRTVLWLSVGGVFYFSMIYGLYSLTSDLLLRALRPLLLCFFPLPVLLWVLLAVRFPGIDRSWGRAIVGLVLLTLFSSCAQPVGWYVVTAALQAPNSGTGTLGGVMTMPFLAIATFLPVLVSLFAPRLVCRPLRPGAFSGPRTNGDTPHSG